MELEDAIRLATLVDEHRRTVKRLHSLERRIVRLLLAHPDDTALAATTLAALDSAVLRCHVISSARIQAARHGDDFDALLAAQDAAEADGTERAEGDTGDMDGNRRQGLRLPRLAQSDSGFTTHD